MRPRLEWWSPSFPAAAPCGLRLTDGLPRRRKGRGRTGRILPRRHSAWIFGVQRQQRREPLHLASAVPRATRRRRFRDPRRASAETCHDFECVASMGKARVATAIANCSRDMRERNRNLHPTKMKLTLILLSALPLIAGSCTSYDVARNGQCIPLERDEYRRYDDPAPLSTD